MGEVRIKNADRQGTKTLPMTPNPKSGLTPRAADLGYAPRYLEFFLGWEFSPFRRRVHAPTPSG